MTYAILTAVGSDRPGLVDEVSQYIYERGGNIEDSRMVNLRGQFAMMVLVGGEEPVLQRLQDDLPGLMTAAKLHAEIRPAEAHRATASAEALPYRLTATGLDQPGLVHRVAHVLRSQNVNIESMETRLAPAPITGAPLFEMELTVSIPRSTSLGQLRQRLGALCDDLNVDWQLVAM